MLDITRQNFEAELITASHRPARAARHLGAVVRPVQGARPGAGEARDRLRRPLQAGQARLRREPEIAQQLSQMFGVRSIPFCVLFKGGQPVDGFVGALPEGKIREFLDKHVPSERRAGRRGAAAGGRGAARRRRHRRPRSTSCRHARRRPTRPTTTPASTTCGPLLPPAASPTPRWPSSRWPAQVAARSAARRRSAHWLAAMEAAPASRGARGRRSTRASPPNKRDFDARFELAQLALRRAAMDRGDGRAARDPDARQGLEATSWRARPTSPSSRSWASRAGAAAAAAAPKQGTLEVAGKMATAPADPVVDAYRRKLSMALF